MEFQSTRPHGARPDRAMDLWFDKVVSIHAPAWGATFASPVKVRDDLVSIHAPAWGATSSEHGYIVHDWVSIHAPAWGATFAYNKPASTLMFQSTRPHGARLQEHGERRGDLAVSIHAPAWGATSFVEQLPIGTRVSIHAPAWGATLKLPALDVITESFNPRARMGRDHPAVSCEVQKGVSIHAPAWGATGREPSARPY